MARNITIDYGLLSVACKYEPAAEQREGMRNLCVGQPGKPQHDPTPLTMPKQCATCGPITDFTVIKKGIAQGKTFAVVDQTDVAEAKKQNVDQYKHKIDIVPVPASDFLTATGTGKSMQYVTPAAGSEDHYQLLVKLVQEHPERAFVGLYTPVSAVGLYRLAVRDGVLMMEERTREQNMKPAPQVEGEVNEPMYDLLEATLDKMSTEYDPNVFEDTYAIAVAELAIAAQDSVTVGAEAKATTKATVKASDADLMAKLKALAES